MPDAAQFVQCTRCLATAVIPPGQDPHATSFCGCCPEDHHHGMAAGACPRDHAGDCWHGPHTGPRPDGCTVCRPLIFHGNAVVSLATGA